MVSLTKSWKWFLSDMFSSEMKTVAIFAQKAATRWFFTKLITVFLHKTKLTTVFNTQM